MNDPTAYHGGEEAFKAEGRAVNDDTDPEAEEFFADTVGETSERDVWAGANLLIENYGHDAPLFAAMRADDWLARGDIAQYRLSKRILTAVDELLMMAPPAGTRPC